MPSNTLLPGALWAYTSETNDTKVSIAVTDQGKGIPADELPFIFDRFRRGALTRTEEPGSGLGLAIVQRIVEFHGGRVRVESIAGKGSTFFIEFPNRSAFR